MSDDDTHLRFLARSLEPNRWGGAAPLPTLKVEDALSAVLARAAAQEDASAQAWSPALVSASAAGERTPQVAPRGKPARRAGRGRWTRSLAAALLMIGGFAPWLAGISGPEGREQGSQGVLAVSTAAVVYSQHSGSHNG